MINVSTAFKQALANGTPVYARAKITLSDGTELELTSENDFFINGNSYSEGGSDGFMLGETICKTINISIDNHDERFSEYDFYKSQIILYSEIDLDDGTTEPIYEGIFTVVDSVTPGDIIEFSAYDNMYKTNVRYTKVHSSAVTTFNLLNNICNTCGLSIGTIDFKNRDFVIKKVPTDSTCRDLIGYIAQIASGNAYITPLGALAIKSYNLEKYYEISVINGGNLADNISDKINGGNLADGTTNVISSNTLGDSVGYHILCDFTSNPEVATDDITITGVFAEVETEGDETTKYLVGEDGYTLKIENPLITDDIMNGLNLIAENVVGLTVRPFSGSFAPNPTIECMDTVLVIDRKYNTYQSLVTGFTYNYLGDCEVENATKSPEKNAAVYSSNASVIYQQTKKLVEQNKVEWERAVEDLDRTIKNSTGLYETKEIQSDNESIIYYFHDKPLLDESQLVIKIAKDAIGISNTGKDGLYDVGINTITGTAILKEIYTIGLNADYIKTGSLSANRIQGGILKLGGENNGYGEIEVYDFNNVLVGNWKNSSFETYSANFKGIATIGNKTLQDRYWIEISGVDNSYLGQNIRFYANQPSNNASVYDFTIGMRDDASGARGAIFVLSNRADFIGFSGFNYRSFWYQSTAETHSALGEIEANTINSSVNFDMHGKKIKNSVLEEARGSLKDCKFENITEINNKTPLTGTVPFVKEIQTDPNGIVTSRVDGTLTFENGILVGW